MSYKALILCAGFGTRLGTLTKNTPKPMLLFTIGGFKKPLLELTINNLKNHGIDNIAINLHYLPDKIINHFGDGSKLGIKISYNYEDSPMGTAGALKLFEKFFSDEENFFVIYGDILTDFDFSKLMQFHKQHKKKATIVLHQRKGSNSYVEMDDLCRIISFIERPNMEQIKNPDASSWVNSAIYCFHRSILEDIPNQTFCDFPKDVFPQLVQAQQLYGFPIMPYYRIAIDSEERYFRAQQEIESCKINISQLLNN